MELDGIAPKTLGVERRKLWRMRICLPAALEHRGRAPAPAEGRQCLGLGAARIVRDRILERPVAAIKIHVLIGRRLVRELSSIHHRKPSLSAHPPPGDAGPPTPPMDLAPPRMWKRLNGGLAAPANCPYRCRFNGHRHANSWPSQPGDAVEGYA